jgi:surfactin synthase thioesterase subunit
MNIFLPAIRADYTAIDNYTYTDAPPLASRLVAFAGKTDEKAPPGTAMEGWRRFTEEKMKFGVDVFQGGHFFIKENECGKVVVERIGKLVFGLED